LGGFPIAPWTPSVSCLKKREKEYDWGLSDRPLDPSVSCLKEREKEYDWGAFRSPTPPSAQLPEGEEDPIQN